MWLVPNVSVHQSIASFAVVKKGIKQIRYVGRSLKDSPRLKTRICLFEKILRLWGDKSPLFTDQQLKHACKWIITINSRILHALACLVLPHPMVFVSWTIFSADSYWKACFAKNRLPSRGSPRVHWWLPWQFHVLSALCTTPTSATHNNLLPGSVGVNSLPFTNRSVWFSPAQHPAHAGHVHI